MNKRKALEKLIEYLQDYSENSVFYFHKKFVEELGNIIQKNAVGYEKEVFNIMIKQFSFVKTMGNRVNEVDSNEILNSTGKDKDYYSLHIQNKIVNIRMLMTFSNENCPMFLAAFFEKAGKRVSDYSQWLMVIKERYEQMEGVQCEE